MDIPLPLIAAAGLSAAVWTIVFALRLSNTHACLGVLVTVACFGSAFAKFQLGPVAASADRLIILAAVAIASLKRLVLPQPRLRLDRTDWLLAALLAMLAFSIWMHQGAPVRSFRTPGPKYLFVASYLFPALIYWIVRFRDQADRDLRGVLWFFVIFGVYLALTAICEVHGPGALVFPKYILKTRVLYAGRAVGPFLSAPALGTWLTVAAVCAVLLWNRATLQANRLVIALLLPLFAYAQYLTQTRSAWMGFVAAVPLAAMLSAGKAVRPIIVVAILIVAVVAGLGAGDEFLMPDRAEGRGVVAQSTAQRLALFQISTALFVDRPLFGWGFGRFEHVAPVHGGDGPIQWVPNSAARGLASHNVFLRFLAETGIIGACVFLGLLASWWIHGCRILKDPRRSMGDKSLAILFLCAATAYFSEGMFHDVTFIPQDNILIFFLAGLIAAIPHAPAHGAFMGCDRPAPARSVA